VYNDTIVATLFVLVGLAFGTIGLLTARSGLVRAVIATTGYLLAAWQLWVLIFDSWQLPDGLRGAALGLGLVALLGQGASLVIRSRQGDRPLPATAGHRRDRAGNSAAPTLAARHRVDGLSRTPTSRSWTPTASRTQPMYGTPYRGSEWPQPASPMVGADARAGAGAANASGGALNAFAGAPGRSDVPATAESPTWSDLEGDPGWTDRWTTGTPQRRPSSHRWATHDGAITDWLGTLDR
jgi:hypothetical protein